MKSIIRKLLTPRGITILKTFRERVSKAMLKFFSLNARFSGIYYALFSTQFDKEHHSVLKGRIKYAETQQRFDQSSSPLLRRNVHRLEKGLIMQPRRAHFAQNYIQETVNAFIAMSNFANSDKEELDWAHHVLTEYFSTVEHVSWIKSAFEDFKTVPSIQEAQLVPYYDKDRVRSTISKEQLSSLFWQRRSTRWYTDKAIETSLIDEAIKLASLAPSACNRQPFEFFVSSDQNKAIALCKLAVGTSGFVDNIPCAIAIVGDLSAYPQEKDRHLIYIDSSLASMQLMLALEVQGLSSCPLNWPEINWREKKVSQLLNLPPEKRVIMLLAVGYADQSGMIPYSQKKSVNQLKTLF
jgi:nitroreductase